MEEEKHDRGVKWRFTYDADGKQLPKVELSTDGKSWEDVWPVGENEFWRLKSVRQWGYSSLLFWEGEKSPGWK